MIKRELYLSKVRNFIDTNFIKVFLGIRRSGKSTLLLQIAEELLARGVNENQIVQINFEDYQYNELKNKDKLYDFLISKLHPTKKTYILLDEIQEVNRFEEIVNSLNVTKNTDFYLTGSNSRMLSGDYATLLTGRYISFKIFPFSFLEMKQYYPIMENEKLFNMYINYGGLPSLQIFENSIEKKLILSDLYNSIIIKDLVKRYKIRDVEHFERFLIYLLNSMSKLLSAKKISDYFKNEGRSISKETLYNYINYAKEAYFIFTAPRYDVKGKMLLTTNEKIFINDQGFRSLKFNNEADVEKVFENIIYFELLRRGYEVYVGNIDAREVDFIATKDGKKEYYQVAYILSSEATVEREFRSLLQIEDAYPKFVISSDKFDFSKEGIIHKNIIDFLSEESKD